MKLNWRRAKMEPMPNRGLKPVSLPHLGIATVTTNAKYRNHYGRLLLSRAQLLLQANYVSAGVRGV